MIRILLLCTLLFSTICTSQTVQNGEFKLFYPNGLLQEEGVRAANKVTGTQYYYNRNILSRKIEYTFSYSSPGNFVDYQHEEIIYDYNRNGDLIETSKRINGVTQAKDEEYYANGQIKQTKSKNTNGGYTIISYYPNGQPSQKSSYIKIGNYERAQGTRTRWREDGTLLVQEEFEKGLKSSDRKAWNEKGQLIEIFTYRNDTLIGIQRWNNRGTMTHCYLEGTPPETHFQLVFQADDSTLAKKTYAKKYEIDGKDLILNFIELYDQKGKLTSVSVRDANVKNNSSMHYGIENFITDKRVENYTFSFTSERNSNDKFHFLQPHAQAERMGFWIKNEVLLPIDGTSEEYRAIIAEKLKEVMDLVKKDKVNESHQFDPKNLPKAEAYYNKYLDEVVFKQARTISNFDSTMTGNYQIIYYSTDMRFEGYLYEGLMHGTCTLYLNDSIKLFERNFQYGVPHGEWREWFLTGDIAYDLVFDRGIKIEHYYYYLDGGIAEHEGKSQSGHTNINDKFKPDGQPISLNWTEDSISRSLQFDENGKVTSYQWYDWKNDVSISKREYNGKQTASFRIPPVPGPIYDFELKRNGIEITGKFFWDSVNKVNVLEDNIGTYTQGNPNEIAYPENLPCDCRDWEKSDFFMPITSKFVKEEKFNKYQLDFHAPVSLFGIFGDPYYMNEAPDNYIIGKTYSVYSNFITLQGTVFHLPDTNGLSFSLAPCRSKYAFINQSVGLKFRVGFPEETELTITRLKTLELAFPSTMLRQVNTDFNALKDSKNNDDIPGSFLFDATRVNYNKTKELDVIEPRYKCSRPMEIAHTKMILETQNLFPDLSRTENYPMMNERWNLEGDTIDPRLTKLGIEKSKLSDFTGAFITRGKVHIPHSAVSSGFVAFEIDELAISSEFAILMLRLEYDFLDDHHSIANEFEARQLISIDELIASIKELSGVNTLVERDDETSSLTVLMYLEK